MAHVSLQLFQMVDLIELLQLGSPDNDELLHVMGISRDSIDSMLQTGEIQLFLRLFFLRIY